MSDELKCLLLMIEGDLNAAIKVLPLTADRHPEAAFRARFVTLYHCLSSLRRLDAELRDSPTRGLDGMRDLLAEDAAVRVLSRTGELLRNRCVHYEVNDPRIVPALDRPMCGLVEALDPEWSWEQVDVDVDVLLRKAAGNMAFWGR